jgi:hypothetical protein
MILMQTRADEILFNDDFDSGKINPEWKKEKKSKYQIKDGCLVLVNGESIVLPLKERKPFIFTCTLKGTHVGFKYPGINISFIEQGEKGHYMLHLKPEGKREKAFYYIWEKESNSKHRNVLGFSYFSKLGMKFHCDRFHKFAVSFSADQTLRFYWDEALILEKSNIFFCPDRIKIEGSQGINLYIDNVIIQEDKSSKNKGSLVFESNFSDINSLVLSGHENYNEKQTISGNEVIPDAHQKSVRLKYDFKTKGHDAFMLSKNINVEKADYLSIKIKGNGSKHRIFFVLTDATGEKHYLACKSLRNTNWAVLDISLEEHLKPLLPGEVTGNSWGGDANQKIDFPITQIMVGINDIPDSFIGNGEFEVSEFQFWKK